VIDEAHYATSPSYVKFMALYPNAYVLPVTATPYTSKGLRHIAETVVKPIRVAELIEQGYLAPPRYFSRSLPDLKGVRSSTGKDGKDFVQAQLSAIMENSPLMGDIAKHWLEKAKGRPTVAFCCSVKHSIAVKDSLLEQGIRAAHVDANSSDEERQHYIDQLEAGELDVLCNCGILCTGVDIPKASCIILARPTKSLNLHIQQMGRGTRMAPGKNDFIVLDHAGNVLRHGFITDEHEANLDEYKEKEETAKRVTKTCEECYAVFEGKECPECGNTNLAKTRSYASVDGNLEELSPEDLDPVSIRIKELKKVRKDKGYKRGWLYHRIKEEFGEIIAEQQFPRREVPWWINRGS